MNDFVTARSHAGAVGLGVEGTVGVLMRVGVGVPVGVGAATSIAMHRRSLSELTSFVPPAAAQLPTALPGRAPTTVATVKVTVACGASDSVAVEHSKPVPDGATRLHCQPGAGLTTTGGVDSSPPICGRSCTVIGGRQAPDPTFVRLRVTVVVAPCSTGFGLAILVMARSQLDVVGVALGGIVDDGVGDGVSDGVAVAVSAGVGVAVLLGLGDAVGAGECEGDGVGVETPVEDAVGVGG